jgi:hypothetical protein
MKTILEFLQNSLENIGLESKELLKEKLLKSFGNKDISCMSDYPVAIVHDKKDEAQVCSFEFLATKNVQDVRKVDIVALTNDVKSLTFTAKRPHDFWKRLSSVEHIKALVSVLDVSSKHCTDSFIETSVRESKKGQWSVEAELRDAMRANKENRDLGVKPFIILLSKDYVEEETDHLQALLKHYFFDDVVCLTDKEKTVSYYLGFHQHMGEIGMRYFYRFDLKPAL